MMYNGDACIPEATHILIQLAMVYDLSKIRHNYTLIVHMFRYNLSLLFGQYILRYVNTFYIGMTFLVHRHK